MSGEMNNDFVIIKVNLIIGAITTTAFFIFFCFSQVKNKNMAIIISSIGMLDDFCKKQYELINQIPKIN